MTEPNNEGIVTEHSIQLPGMASGTVGMAGENRAGATIRVVAVNPIVYIGIEILWAYLHTFLGLLAIDGLGLVDLAPAHDALAHLLKIGGIALAPALVALLQELYQYLGKIRASREA